MAIQNIKNQIHQGIEEIFALAAVDEMAGDADAHRDKLKKIATIAVILGISTEIKGWSLNLKSEK